MSDKAIRSTTQEFLDVYDIVNDMVLLKDGTAAVILQVGTMNFSLLAEQEQDAVIFTYGSLLNSLNYPIQINIQSQTKDATKYLRLLDEQITKASSDRKAALIRQYRDFVAALIKERNVLQKRFYIIVPATPGEMGLITPSSVLPGKNAFDINSVEKSVLIEKATNILEPRRDHLTSQFNRLGLYVRQLSTQEIIQNFYINYNPEAVEGQEISSSENYTTPLVRASFGGKFMQLNNQSGNPVQDQAAPVTQLPQGPSAEEILSGNPAPNPSAPVAPASTPAIDAQATSNVITAATAEPLQPIVAAPTTLPVAPTPLEPAVTLNPATPLEPVAPAVESVTEIIQQPIVSPIVDSSPIAEANPAINSVNVTEPMTTPEPTIQETSQDLDISLDSNLIDSSLSEPEISLPQAFVEETPNTSVAQPVVEPTLEQTPTIMAPEVTDEPEAQTIVQPQEENVLTKEPANDFAEEITPLQSKFEAELKPDQN